MHTESKVALLGLIQNACPNYISALPLNAVNEHFVPLLYSLTQQICRTAEPRGFCSCEGFAACQSERSDQPTGVIRGERSFDYNHYLVNKMSTRCFLDTSLSKRRKVQK